MSLSIEIVHLDRYNCVIVEEMAVRIDITVLQSIEMAVRRDKSVSQWIKMAVRIDITVSQSIDMAFRITMTVLQSIETRWLRRDIPVYTVNRDTSRGIKLCHSLERKH